MATKFDVTGLVLNPDEVTNVSEIIVEKGFLSGKLSDNYDVHTGISHDQSIVFLASLGITGKALTSCTPAEIGGLVFTEKVWTPKLIAGRFSFCITDENQLIKWLKQAQKVYNDYFDRSNSTDLQMVAAAILMSMEESIPAKAWFSDTTADDYAGGGVFTNGTDLGLFNQFDGLFKQIFADAGIPVHAITQNAGASYVAQALPTDGGLAILTGVHDNADSRLTSDPQAKFYVTGDLYKNFLYTLANKEYNGGITKTIEDGRTQLQFLGIPIYEELMFDRIIKTYQDNGTKWNLPHRVVLTTQDNIPIGTLSTTDLDSLRTIFDEPNNVTLIDFGYFLDAKHGENYRTSVAY